MMQTNLTTTEGKVAAIRSLRVELLFDEDGDECPASLPPRAEQCYCKALAFLDLAACEMKMADYFRMQNQ